MTQAYRSWQTPDLEILENSLEQALTPAPPRAEFVDRLRHRLETKSKSEPRFGSNNPGQIVLLALAGAVSGAIILVMGVQIVKVIRNQRGASRNGHSAITDSVITIPAA
jgi:hypothetical protein